ncbi:hypothetical protein SEEPB585_23076, partial [Salmonella enterica subsp. enterica serovar Paratyphi B str. ATCC BAA-1585]
MGHRTINDAVHTWPETARTTNGSFRGLARANVARAK